MHIYGFNLKYKLFLLDFLCPRFLALNTCDLQVILVKWDSPATNRNTENLLEGFNVNMEAIHLIGNYIKVWNNMKGMKIIKLKL